MRGIPLLVAMAMLLTVDVRADDAGTADLARMQGDWMGSAMKSHGMEQPAEEAQALFRTIEGNNYTVSRYTKLIGRGIFKLDASQSPKAIDSTPAPPADPNKPIRGIYEFDGEQLRICNAPPGQPRPKTFDAKMYTGHTLIVWEREVK